MTTTTIISHQYLQRARHWPEDFTDLIKPYTKPNEVAFFSFYRCGIGSTAVILIWPKSYRGCGRMRFPSMCLSQQLLFTSTDAITPLSTWPGSCVHRLPAAPSGPGRGGPAFQRGLREGLTHPHLGYGHVGRGGETGGSCQTPAPICPVISIENRISPSEHQGHLFKLVKNEAIRYRQADEFQDTAFEHD